jgi:predicted nuclease of predicted toxin-antitoxin system
MKILLDECIDRRLARKFVDYEVKTVPQMGWAGIKDAQLLVLAEAAFDVFITVDRNLSFQQNFAFPEIYQWSSKSCIKERTLQDRRSHYKYRRSH